MTHQLHMMVGPDAMVGSDESPALPQVRKIALTDIKKALVKGVDDFRAFPTHVIFLSIIYPIIGIAIARLTLSYDFLPLLFPLAAGFALIGPVAATGLYELSRRRELGLDVEWRHAFGARQSASADGIMALGKYAFGARQYASIGGILALGVLLLVIFGVWIAAAQAIYIATFGYEPAASIPDFLGKVFTTPAGWTLILAGNGAGFLFALAVLTISVVSFPLLLDRDVGAVVALVTSVRAVLRNPLPMAVWGLIVAGLLLIGTLPLFVGLAVVMPILGHSTWHLYRAVVVPPERRAQPPEPSASPRQVHYAAQFPASLLAGENRR
jgi:uncharacterized membrane protein